MKLMTIRLREKLIKNYRRRHSANYDPVPVVKYFTPDANATWLITDMDPKTNILFGLCDLGIGFPELGTVCLDELETVKGPFGLSVERDLHTIFDKPLSFYTTDALYRRCITA